VQKNPATEQSKIIKWSESQWNQPGRKGFAEERRLKFRLKEYEKMQVVIVKMVKTKYDCEHEFSLYNRF